MTQQNAVKEISTGSGYHRLTREELRAFDREAKDMILDAMEAGCLGRVSSKGHVILRNNTGGTASVPRNLSSANRAGQNARADMRKLLAQHRKEIPAEEISLRIPTETRKTTVHAALSQFGAPFVRWLDSQPGGLPAEAEIEAEVTNDGTASFSVISIPKPTPVEKSDSVEASASAPVQPAPVAATPTTKTEKPVTAVRSVKTRPKNPTPAPSPTASTSTTSAEDTLRRIRDVLGDDPQVLELKTQVIELEAQLAAASQRADAAQERIDRILQALSA